MPLLSQPIDPFEGLAASIVTSNVIDCRDAYLFTLSCRTISGTSSVLSYELSNSTLGITEIPEASWSFNTLIGLASGKSVYNMPVGVRFARVRRTVSGGSYVLEGNKLVR